MNELRLIGKSEQASEMLAKEISTEGDYRRVVSAVSLMLDEKMFDTIPAKLDHWYSLAMKFVKEKPVQGVDVRQSTVHEIQLAAAIVAYPLSRWLGKLGEDEENQKILEELDRFLNLTLEETKYRIAVDAASSKRRSSTGYYRESTSETQWYYGDKAQYSEFPTPTQATIANLEAIQTIRQCFEILNRNEVAEDLIKLLRKRVEQADAADRIYEQVLLATALGGRKKRRKQLNCC